MNQYLSLITDYQAECKHQVLMNELASAHELTAEPSTFINHSSLNTLLHTCHTDAETSVRSI